MCGGPDSEIYPRAQPNRKLIACEARSISLLPSYQLRTNGNLATTKSSAASLILSPKPLHFWKYEKRCPDLERSPFCEGLLLQPGISVVNSSGLSLPH